MDRVRTGTQTELSIPFGCESFGRLTRVALWRPRGLERITKENCRHLLFDAVPDIPAFLEAHDLFRETLERLGVEVIELGDHVEDPEQTGFSYPNLTYLHDTAAISSKGALLSQMTSSRRGEEAIVRACLSRLGVPMLTDFDAETDEFEGCLLLFPTTILVARTERHSWASISRFIDQALLHFPEVVTVEVPAARRYMHPEMVFGRVHERLALAYPPALGSAYQHTPRGATEIALLPWLGARGVKVIPVSDEEQKRLACSFVPVDSRLMVHYDDSLDRDTRRSLHEAGVEILTLPHEPMRAGGGGLRCLTLRMARAPS